MVSLARGKTMNDEQAHHLSVLPAVPGPLDAVLRQLLFRAKPAWGSVVGITSALDGEGKTTISREIAHGLSSATPRERPVLLLDCKQPLTLRGASVPPEAPPSAALVKYGALTDLQQYRDIERNAGDPNRSPIDALRARHSFILLDMPSVLNDTIAADLAQQVDHLYLVVRSGATRADFVEQAVERVGRSRVDGIILNDVPKGPPRWLMRLVS